MRLSHLPSRLFPSQVCLTIAAALALCAPRAAQDVSPAEGARCTPAEQAKRLDEHFSQREREGFSGVILLAIDGEVVLEKAYGHRDPESQAPMRATDVFDVGSLVKPITHAAIRKLEAEGELRLDDHISRFFADVPEDKRKITIRHVLEHRAGFPDTLGRDYELVDRETLRKQLFNAPLIAPIDEAFNYSNSGYSLLAMVIEEVGGKPYEEWIRDEIMDRAGVEGFGYRIPYWRADTLAVGIRRNGERFGTPLDHAWYGDGPSWNLRGNGGMLANARAVYDLFLDMEENDDVLGREARLKWRPPTLPGEERASSAFGGNGIFNAAIIRSVRVTAEGERRQVTFVGLSNIGGQDIERSAEFLQEVLKIR